MHHSATCARTIKWINQYNKRLIFFGLNSSFPAWPKVVVPTYPGKGMIMKLALRFKLDTVSSDQVHKHVLVVVCSQSFHIAHTTQCWFVASKQTLLDIQNVLSVQNEMGGSWKLPRGVPNSRNLQSVQKMIDFVTQKQLLDTKKI